MVQIGLESPFAEASEFGDEYRDGPGNSLRRAVRVLQQGLQQSVGYAMFVHDWQVIQGAQGKIVTYFTNRADSLSLLLRLCQPA